MRHLSNVMNHFWKRWRDEYLLKLRNSHRKATQHSSNRVVSIGDMVIVYDENQLRRPLQRLYPLEVRCRNDEPETTISFRRVEPGPTANSVRSEQHPELSDRPRRVPTNSGSSPEKENTAKEFDVRNLSDFELRTVVVVVSIPF